MKFKGLTDLVLGTNLALVGHDTPGDLVLNEIEIKGNVKVKLIQEVINGSDDNYRLDVYDEESNLRITLKTGFLYDGTKIVDENGRAYTIKNGKRFYEQDKDFKINKKEKTDSGKKEGL